MFDVEMDMLKPLKSSFFFFFFWEVLTLVGNLFLFLGKMNAPTIYFKNYGEYIYSYSSAKVLVSIRVTNIII